MGSRVQRWGVWYKDGGSLKDYRARKSQKHGASTVKSLDLFRWIQQWLTLAWKIPWTEEPGRLQSMGSQRVGHDWVTELNWLTDLKNKGWKLTVSLEYGTTTRFYGSLLTLFFGYTWKVIKRIYLAAECRRRIGNRVFMLLYFLTEILQGHGEGNGNPLQYSCLENPMDGGAW